MKPLIPSLAVASFLMSGAAGAHAHLEKSTPAEGSVLTSSPTALEMTFSEAARLTALSIQKDHEPKQSVKSSTLMALAAANKSRLGPAVALGSTRAFKRSLVAEYALIAAVLAVTASMTA